ncbi:universal stress protein [Halobacteriaceae archaeon GCM10025711]
MAADGNDADDDDYQLLVAVGNPDTARQLCRTAVDVAAANDGEILVLSAVIHSRDSPFSVFSDESIVQQFGSQQQSLLDRAVDQVEEAGVPVTGELAVGTDLARTIIETMEEHGSDAILMGWRERPRSDFVLGSNVDQVITEAPGDVLVEKIGPTADGVDSILLPTADSPHAVLAAETARAIALANDATVHVVHAIDPETSAVDRETAEEVVAATTNALTDVDVETDVVESTDVGATVVDLAADHDITVIGASRKGRLRRFVIGTVTKTVGREAPNTVIVTSRNRDATRLTDALGGSR